MKLAAAMLVVVGLSTTAHAAETGTLTLACKGTTTAGGGAKPDPFSMSMMVNFTAGTVQGFGVPGLVDVPVKITAINDVTVAFGGLGRVYGIDWTISGTIDRVTGDVEATQFGRNASTGEMLTSTAYSLKCRPTQRLF
jgi:hypothetical protein